MQGVKRYSTQLLTYKKKTGESERELLDFCQRIRRETGKAGVALTTNLKKGFFTPLSVSLQAILARVDFVLDKICASAKALEKEEGAY